MGMSTGRKRSVRAEINITPYIDILLVLLIIFMVAASVKQHDHPVRAPKPAPADQRNASVDAIIVEIDRDHSIRLNQQPVALHELESTLSRVLTQRVDKSLFVRGDESLAYGEIFKVLDAARRSGALDIALLGKNQKGSPAGAQSGSR
jgi:biopolymer transport protein ExbD